MATFPVRARIGHIITQSHYLYHFGLKDTSVCGNCDEEEETLEHILIQWGSQNSARENVRILVGEDGSLENVLK